MNKISIASATALFLCVLAFQNCGRASSSETTPTSAASASNGGVVAIHACPTYDTPTCATGSLVQSTDVDGCAEYTCTNGQAFSCPTYTMPACSASQVATEITSATGCDVKKCMPATQF